MIQRIQSLFLALAVILGIVTLCVPVATFDAIGMAPQHTVYCLFTRMGDGSTSWMSLPLFVLQAVAIIISAATIFLFKNRVLQMKLCMSAMFATIFWVAALAVILYFAAPEGYTASVGPFCALPIVQYILLRMARQRISADEKLVRSIDRIR